MGQYNPHAPYIIGQEWVPIRNAFYVPDGVVERGYEFTIDATTTPVSGAFYVNDIPGNLLAGSCDFISVYPAGHESLTGPIKSVRIPASAISVTNPGSIDITEGVAALLNPEDNKSIIFDADTGIFSQLQVSFDTNAYAEILLNKRIVDVRLRYSFVSGNVANSENLTFRIHNQSSFNGVAFPDITDVVNISDVGHVSVLSITELNPTWNTNVLFRGQRTVLPWRFQELNRFRAGAPAAEALTIFIQNNVEVFSAGLRFLDLEILFCEETRVLYGGFRTYDSNISNFPVVLEEFYNIGALAVQLYNPVTFTPGATLPSGSYVVTVYHRDMSAKSTLQGAPKIHALREYYQLPHQRGVHVRQTTTLDDQFTREETEVLTQLTLHTATQIVTGSHPYGTQYGAPVYGSRTVTQEIEDNPAHASARYPQVRFYARRYGNTTIPLTLTDVATGAFTVSISVADFDALEEIVDGWREVNLRFTTGPTFTPTTDDVDWRWSASSELAGNQWQIMVADGPSGSWQPNPTAAATGPATYWAPLGATVGLTWQSPTISGAAFDSTSDAVLIFSQDPPSVTGFAVSVEEQELDVALRCETTPRCVPTALSYVNFSWSLGEQCDDFERTPEVNGFGTANSGQTWTVSGGSASNYATDGERAVITIPTGDTTIRTAMLPNVLGDFNLRTSVSVAQVATGQTQVIDIPLRAQDPLNNLYRISLGFTTGGMLDTSLVRVVGGAGTTLASAPSAFAYVANQEFHVYAEGRGGRFRVRIWTGDVEPSSWLLNPLTEDTTYAFGQYGVRARIVSGNTNVNPIFSFEEFEVTNPAFDSIELQRRDTYDADWQTIMLGTSACLSSFSDYEARVGVLSEYRIRTLNALDFAGPWVTGSATIPAPGVDVVGSGNSLLIFTSNEQPDSNLAYVMQFEGQPVELFSFPEADTVSLQRLFGRDFFLAVRPLERGGDRFSRVILVNNAAIALPSLANFTGLRDLAWADVNYVCVRDELGNRWFATVIVPEGTVRNDRTIYLARIDVAEVTNTPTVLDS